jgi:hypothetical protein
MNEESSNDRPAGLWMLWTITVLAVPCFLMWALISLPGSGYVPTIIGYAVILSVSLLLGDRWAEPRRGSWEWFVETVERGVPLSILGTIIAAIIGILVFVAFAFTVGFTG